ncbi:MAG TPA: site-specific integrase [Polyangiales bacterium]|jgi:integrase|nr:site-specific integrase [Polyangiales bacterium]
MYWLVKPRRKHPYWNVRIQLPGQKRKEYSTKCKLKRDARPVAERLHSEAASGLRREKLLDALGALIGLRLRQKRAAATIEKLTEKSEQLIKFFGEDKDVLTMTVDDATDYVVHRRAQGVSDSTIAMEWTVMTSAMKRLRKRELLPYEPNSRWPDELEHGAGVRDRWLPWQEYLRVLAAIATEFRDHFVIYCAMGLRWSELYTLQAKDVIRVGDGLEVRVRGTKTAGAARTVPATPDAAEVLLRRADEHKTGPMFPMTHGKVEAQETAWARALKEACRTAGVEHASTNDLRRTFASRAFQADVAEALLIKWMGHTSSAMVRRVYAQASSDQHQREVEKLPSRSKRKPAPKREAEEG